MPPPFPRSRFPQPAFFKITTRPLAELRCVLCDESEHGPMGPLVSRQPFFYRFSRRPRHFWVHQSTCSIGEYRIAGSEGTRKENGLGARTCTRPIDLAVHAGDADGRCVDRCFAVCCQLAPWRARRSCTWTTGRGTTLRAPCAADVAWYDPSSRNTAGGLGGVVRVPGRSGPALGPWAC